MKRFPWRIVLYAVFLLYLFLDLRIYEGPLRQAFSDRERSLEDIAAENGWVAVVNQEPISRDQLALAAYRHLYQRGKEGDPIPEKNLEMIRLAVLNSLIDDLLVKQFADGDDFEAPAQEIEAFIETWEAQFGTAEELAERSRLQELGEEERRETLSRIWSRKRWLEQRIEPGVDVKEKEVRAWFDANQEDGKGFIEPEKVRARQIFLSTVMEDTPEREELIRTIHRQISEGEGTFEEFAAEFSEDLRTKRRGGDLNWFARDRVAQDFGDRVFALEIDELSDPFRTRIGWHIVKLEEREEARPVLYEEVQEEIRHHLETEYTVETIKQLMEKLREVSNIRLFLKNL